MTDWFCLRFVNQVRSSKSPDFLNGSSKPQNIVLGDLGEVRTYEHKAERAVALIYAHFKKEFGLPIRHITEPANDNRQEISLKE